MTDLPLTFAERQATAATNLPAFPINLPDVRANVRLILDGWKTGGLFHEYTDHSFQHVADMLETCEWIIPQSTKAILTPADWLMLVLSVYFHDLGLLVTKQEVESRSSNAEFASFKANPILDADKQREYDAQLAQLAPADADLIRYQDFVRFSHGRRVRSWIDGTHLNDGGASDTAREVVGNLLSKLDSAIRKDLALLCESHTLNGIDDVATFKVSRPYGSAEETVNLQYVAAILRTVDLLQITHRRAPSILYQLINPGDPQSQLEWQKQSAVKTVRFALARDREGVVSDLISPNTIEVHALFKDPEGFFGLTRYLAYAQGELTSTFNALQKSKKDRLEPYNFPWRYIDTSHIETEGFLQESFEFELDQHRILDLLTGHTLYNNSTVVLRELTQNALDAIRLQASLDGRDSTTVGHVAIIWDSAARSLIVRDNGTGMSQEIIENHLLKVGSSRYQDAKFKEAHPKFHSISRFGIGVLSAFMVSDDVEITTCYPDELKARRIALRSVHGKYLIKLLDKTADRGQLPMYPHGTEVKISLRPTAEIGDILRVARQWLMFPRCRVSVKIDEAEPIEIGYSSPKKALEDFVDNYLRKSAFKRDYEVREVKAGALTLAFAVAKDYLFQDWGFVDIQRVRFGRDDENIVVPVAVCIEGVAVQQSTPGFQAVNFLAVANAVGPSSPRTNVARSALEDTAEQRNMLASIYELYSKHVSDEVARLSAGSSYSLSRAVGVGPFISSPLTSPSVPPTKNALLQSALAKIPLVLLEEADSRRNISLDGLKELSGFFTVESPLYRSIEYLVKEAPADITAGRLLTTLGNAGEASPGFPIVCNLKSGSYYFEDRILESFQIDGVTVSAESRSIKLHWKRIEDGARIWFSTSVVYDLLRKNDTRFANIVSDLRERFRGSRGNSGERLHVPLGDISLRGFCDEGSFMVSGEKYLLPSTPLAVFLGKAFNSGEPDAARRVSAMLLVLDLMRAQNWTWDVANDDLMTRAISGLGTPELAEYIDKAGFLAAIRDTSAKTFDAFAWDKRSGFGPLGGVDI